MEELEITKHLAQAVKAAGGRAFIVGGFVRDMALGRTSKDVDVEVHELAQATLETVLPTLGQVDIVGRSFGVYKLTVGGYTLDVSLPRRDSKGSGDGHKGIIVSCDPMMGVVEAARRRDLTINAMLFDPLTGETVDPYGGLDDIKARVLREVDPTTFLEDPLRALRAVQFAARFGFTMSESLKGLCRQVQVEHLSPERILWEVEKMLGADDPTVGTKLLDELGISLFDGVQGGDLRLASVYRKLFPVQQGRALMWATLLAGSGQAKAIMDRYKLDHDVRDLALKLQKYGQGRKEDWEVRLMADDVSLTLLLRFQACTEVGFDLDAELLRVERLGVLYGPMPKVVTGKDLIAAGERPGPALGARLRALRVEQAHADV